MSFVVRIFDHPFREASLPSSSPSLSGNSSVSSMFASTVASKVWSSSVSVCEQPDLRSVLVQNSAAEREGCIYSDHAADLGFAPSARQVQAPLAYDLTGSTSRLRQGSPYTT